MSKTQVAPEVLAEMRAVLDFLQGRYAEIQDLGTDSETPALTQKHLHLLTFDRNERRGQEFVTARYVLRLVTRLGPRDCILELSNVPRYPHEPGFTPSDTKYPNAPGLCKLDISAGQLLQGFTNSLNSKAGGLQAIANRCHEAIGGAKTDFPQYFPRG